MASVTTTASGRTTDVSQTMWPDASLVGVALIWGINIPFMKIGLDKIDGYVFNAIRLTVSALVLAVIAGREYRRGIRPKAGLRWRSVVLFGLMVSGLYQLLFLLGMERTTSGNTALIIATVPIWTALIARLFGIEQISRPAWAGLLIALTGTVIVALQKGDVNAGAQHLIGNLIILGAALAWSGGTVFSRKLLEKISPLQLSASAAMMALPLHLVMSIGHYENSSAGLSSGSVWLIIIYSGVLSSGLALPMWNFGVRHAGAAHSAIIQNLVPVIAIIAAWLSRGEVPSGAQLFGGAMIIAGLVTMRMTRKAARPAPIAAVRPTTSTDV